MNSKDFKAPETEGFFSINSRTIGASLVVLCVIVGLAYLVYYLLDTNSSPEGMHGANWKNMESLDRTVKLKPIYPNIPTNIKKSMQDSAGEEIPKADFNMGKLNVSIPKRDTRASRQGDKQIDVMRATKGDGVIRPVDVDGKKYPRQMVEESMFNNADFMPVIDQFPQSSLPNKYDPTEKEPRSQFGPMTFPFHGMGMDVYRRGEKDLTVDIAALGGRFKN